LIKDLKETNCCREGGYTRSVIPTAAFFKIASDVGIPTRSVIGGEDGFEYDRMPSIFLEQVASRFDAFAELHGLGAS
jgi:hypothetical protein